ncbi:MAG: sugar ABC transporter permease [Deinococcota bacterium]
MALAQRTRRNAKNNNFVGYLFISPWLVIFLLFTLIPMLASLFLAFTDYDLLGSWRFVGFENFNRMFRWDFRYLNSVRATLKYVAFAVPLRLVFALLVAMLLNTTHRGLYFYRAAYYAPSIIGGSVAVAVMWREIFGSEGLINTIFRSDTIWLGDPRFAIWTLIILAVWQFGSPMLIFLAGLKQIPRDYYDAAAIDGAGPVPKFFRITLPLLTPIILFNLIMQTISGFLVFTQAFIVTGGAPLDTTLFYALYIYNRAFETFEMGYASAMAVVLLVAVALVTALIFLTSNRWVFYASENA